MTGPAGGSAASDGEPRSRHLRGSTLLLAGRLVALVIGLLSEVLLVRYLPKADYGVFAWGLSIVSLGATLSLVGFDKAVARFITLHQERESGDPWAVVALMAATIMTVGFAIVAVVIWLHDLLPDLGIASEAAVGLLIVMIALAPVRALDAWLVALLAMFASPLAILVRRHLLAPGLELAVVVTAAAASAPVSMVAAGYVAAGVVGLVVAVALLAPAMRRARIEPRLPAARELPFREVFGYAIPLLSSDLVFVLRGAMMVILLEALTTAVEVADFRSVMPIARTNLIVLQTFALLFAPAAARFFARGQRNELNDLYWGSAAWIAVATLPVFLVCFSLAGPLTVFLFGEEYRDAGAVLAILAIGYYLNAAFGFNSLTLRTVGVVRYIVTADVVTIVVSVPLALVLISLLGAPGAAVSLSATLVLQNLTYHAALKRLAHVDLLPRRQAGIYLWIAGAALALTALQSLVAPPLLIGLAAAVGLSGTVLYFNRTVLRVTDIFPELRRIPLVARLFEP